MASYVVMEPPGRDEGENTVLVRDGFHLLALLVPAVWLLWHRLWIEALAVVALGAALGGLASATGLGNLASVPSLLLAILIGLEASSLRIAHYRRRGWREWGVVEADNPRDAEVRYLAEAFGGEEVARAPAAPAIQPHPEAARPVNPSLGLLGFSART